MRIPAISLALLGLLFAASPAGAQAVPKGPTISAAIEECHRADARVERYVTFAVQMNAIPGAARMAIRLDLRMARGKGRYRTVTAPGLGDWHRSAPGVDIFRYRKQVTNLMAGASYRGVMRFRWYDADGHLLRSRRRTTAVCRQPDIRPDLVVAGLRMRPSAQPGLAEYTITVRNVGHRVAGSFDAVLTVGSASGRGRAATALGPGGSEDVVLVAAPCQAGTRVSVTLDPDDRVAESRERNNVRVLRCPA